MDTAQREKEEEIKLVAPDVLVASELDEIAAAKAASGGDTPSFAKQVETEQAEAKPAEAKKMAEKPSEASVVQGVELPKDCKLPDNYRVMEKVGEGGMGQVFRVEDQALKQQLAVKMMNPQYIGDQTARKRFEKEAAAAGDLTHANIAQVYNCSTEGESPYILMEFVDGISFAQLLKQERKLDEQRLITICLQICDALDYAHRRGIVHRDLKPSNIILKQPGDLVKIVDFGIAKLASEKGGATQLTQKGEVFGSPQYMSPEQAKGSLVDYRADLYSLGCIMYESLAGQPLFGGDNAVQILLQHINASIKPYTSILLSKGCSASMVTVIRKLLEKDPSQRYQSAEEVSRDLWRVLERKRPKSLTNMRYVIDMPIFIKTKALAAAALCLVLVGAFMNRDAILRTVGIHNVNQQFLDANGSPNKIIEAKQLIEAIDSGDEKTAAIATKELLTILIPDITGSILENSAQGIVFKNYSRYNEPELKEDLYRVLTTFGIPTEDSINLTIKLAMYDKNDQTRRRAVRALERWYRVSPRSKWPQIATALANDLGPTGDSQWQTVNALEGMDNLPDEVIANLRKKYAEPWARENSTSSKLSEILLKRVEKTGELIPELLPMLNVHYGHLGSLTETLQKLGPKAKAWAPAVIGKLQTEVDNEAPPMPKSLSDSSYPVYLDLTSRDLLRMLGSMGPSVADQAVPVMADALTKWQAPQQKVEAARGLAMMGPTGRAELEKAAKSGDRLTQDAANYGLKYKPRTIQFKQSPGLYGSTVGTIGPQY
jgi:tRNA A-37 threonylcarbamoyl transferase component Bud32